MVVGSISLGVIADTHVPDKAKGLLPQALDVFESEGVFQIIHAGDISIPRVLRELEVVAPVLAVRGNRDWFAMRQLPGQLHLQYHGVDIGVTHGHGNPFEYLWDKVLYLTLGYRFEHYRKVTRRQFPHAKVIIFGHSHVPENRWQDGVLYFNPGTPRLREKRFPPSVGLLRIQPGGNVESLIVELDV